MKTQEHNKGELEDLKVTIEKQVIADLKTMSKNSGMDINEIVVIALKRFRSSHADYMDLKLDYP